MIEKDKIIAISEYLIYKKDFAPGLLVGDLGWCAVLENSDIPNKENYIDNILEKTVAYLNQGKLHHNHDIHKGIGGLYYMISYLEKWDLFDQVDFMTIENKVFSDYKFLLTQNNLDFLYGATGLCASLLQSNFKFAEVADLYIQTLWDLNVENQSLAVALPNKSVINYGIAHGICSIAAILCEFLNKGNTDPRINELLDNIGDTLLNLISTKTNDKIIVPTAVDRSGKIISTVEVFGWCTGRLCYGIMLFRIYSATGKTKFSYSATKLFEEALEIYHPAKLIFSKDNVKQIMEQLCFCHGMSSASLLFELAYEISGSSNFHRKSQELAEDIIDFFNCNEELYNIYSDNLSLIAGLSGITLSLSRNTSNKWRKLILL